MRETAIRTAKWIYRRTPFAPLRRAYVAAFYRAVRRRSTAVTLGPLTYALDLGELIDFELYLGEYEPDVRAALPRYCPPGSVVLDVGANVGAHTLPLAHATGASGRVYAFEPTDYAYGKLTRNLSLNPRLGNVVAVRAALSDRNLPGQDCEFRATWRLDGRHSSYRTRVDYVRLDDWCARQGVDRIDLIKLDVDGHEGEVLAGGAGVIQRSLPTLVTEIGSYHFASATLNPLDLLAQWGYTFFDLSGEARLAPEDIQRACSGRDSVNIIARPAGPRRPLS